MLKPDLFPNNQMLFSRASCALGRAQKALGHTRRYAVWASGVKSSSRKLDQ